MDYKKALLSRMGGSAPPLNSGPDNSPIYTQTGYNNIQEFVTLNNLEESTVPPDGHCILHAVSGALNLTNEDAILHRVWKHIQEHQALYREFSLNETNIENEVISWIINKDFGSNSVDLMLSVLSNTENIKIEIYEECPGMGVVLNCISPTLAPTAGRRTIKLARRGQHYNFFKDNSVVSKIIKVCIVGRFCIWLHPSACFNSSLSVLEPAHVYTMWIRHTVKHFNFRANSQGDTQGG